MFKTIYGIFIILHGLVHVFYLGQSAKWFELSKEFVWPDGSWAFSKWLGDTRARYLASILLVASAIGFVIGGIGVFVNQGWWPQVIISMSAFSAVVYLLLWDGKAERLADKGWVGILINLVLLVALLVFNFPRFD